MRGFTHHFLHSILGGNKEYDIYSFPITDVVDGGGLRFEDNSTTKDGSRIGIHLSYTGVVAFRSSVGGPQVPINNEVDQTGYMIIPNGFDVIDRFSIGFDDNGNSNARLDVTGVDFSVLSLDQFSLGANRPGFIKGSISKDHMPSSCRVWRLQTNEVDYNTAHVPRDVEKVFVDSGGGYHGRVMDWPSNLIVCDIEDYPGAGTGNSDDNILYTGGPVGSNTTRVITQRSACVISFETGSTGFGVSNIGDTPPAGNIETLVFANFRGSVENVLKAERNLLVYNAANGDPGADYRGSSLIPDGIEQFVVGKCAADYVPDDDYSWASTLNTLRFVFKGRVDATKIPWYTNGNSQSDIFVSNLYSVRGSLRSDLHLRFYAGYEDGDRIGYSACAYTKDNLYKMVGLNSYHPVNNSGSGPHNIRDAVDTTYLPYFAWVGQFDAPATINSSTEFVIDSSWIDTGNNFDADGDHRPMWRDNSGTLEIRAILSNRNLGWEPMFQGGEPIALEDDDGKQGLYEISSSTFDRSAGTVTVTIKSSPSITGASGALPSSLTNGIPVYAHHFASTP